MTISWRPYRCFQLNKIWCSIRDYSKRGRYFRKYSARDGFHARRICSYSPHSSSKSAADNRKSFFYSFYFTRTVWFTNIVYEIKPIWSNASSGTSGLNYTNAGKYFWPFMHMHFISESTVLLLDLSSYLVFIVILGKMNWAKLKLKNESELSSQH